MPDNLSLENRLVKVALQQLNRYTVDAELSRRTTKERPEFLMAFACYVMWLIMIGASKTYSQRVVESIVSAIHSEFAKHDWYRAGLFEKIWDEVQNRLPRMKPGRLGVLVPIVHVIEAANFAGCKIEHSNDMEFFTETSLMANELIKSASEQMQNKPWWQFWK